MEITKENLTIIIVTIKSEKVIDNCINSIDPEVKKIVIENSNNKIFCHNLVKKYKNIECHETEKNIGMGPGNNFGIKKSKTRYVMILNPDTILKKNTLEEIYKVSRNLDFAILSPISDNKNFPNYRIDEKLEKIKKKNFFEVDSIDGYSMILDKNKFNHNFFDENIFMYLENDDLCLRVKNMGEKIFISTHAEISHLGAKAVSENYKTEIENSRNWHWNWSQFYYRKKHHGIFNAMKFFIPMFLKSLLKLCFYSFTFNHIDKKKYYYRLSGLVNSFLNKKSSFRPRLD